MRTMDPALPRFGTDFMTLRNRDAEQIRHYSISSIYLSAFTIYYDSMKAIQVTQVGSPEALKLVELPIPEPKPNEAVIQIKAAGVNFIDVYFREGRYPA